MASQFGIDQEKAGELAGLLAPALGSAAKQQAASGNLDSLLGALKGEGQADMFDNGAVAASSEGQAKGAEFLQSLLGGNDATDALSTEAASRSGLDLSTVQQFLPALAAMAQGGLQKNLPDNSIDSMMGGGNAGGLLGMASSLLGGGQSDAQGGGLTMLNNLLDADGDGSALDDILGKFLK